MEDQNEPFNKERRPWRPQTLFRGQRKTIWKPDSYWVVLNLRIALCTLHQLGGEKWLDGGGSKEVRKMGPVMDGVWRLGEKPQERPVQGLCRHWFMYGRMLKEPWYFQAQRERKRKREGKGEGGGSSHHRVPCCMSQPPKHSLQR